MLMHAVRTTCACSGRARCPPVLPQIIDHQFEVIAATPSTRLLLYDCVCSMASSSDLAPAELVMASCFEELDVDVPEITPGSRTSGPALLWRSLAFAGLRYCGARTPYIIPAMARGRRCSRRPVPDHRSGPAPRSLIVARPLFSIFFCV